ncbi:NAD(P)-dependent oxidoreductase [Acuticoccus sp. 2012]|uniref:NAD(P)-dependent oxidoreductase n=2 Tax=Acuticoccus mangrovi TaxID=2796142 RepID=A0A934IPP3_9HYPH|nr:NAD(P)-dependent oxidoreductase [Acuticoccus mangrovi]MBJ3775314.1 NAD(P)-dependent oxidoreductase [Acuticoccus mangrovi]
MDIGVVGLGSMGRHLAANLAAAGHAVRGWNRSCLEPGAVPGVALVSDPTEAMQADTIITMLSDDAAVREILQAHGRLNAARPGAVQVMMATISPALSEELARDHAAAGLGYVAAPVFGTPDVAEAGALNIMAAGPSEAVERVRPVLEVLGKRVFRMGEHPAQANISKIAGNMMITMAIEALAEGITLTEAYGVAPADFTALLTQTLFGCRVYQNYGGKIVEERHAPGFKLTLGLKDLRLATDAARARALSTPMLETVRGRMSEAVEAGLGAEDWSAMARLTRKGAVEKGDQ